MSHSSYYYSPTIIISLFCIWNIANRARRNTDWKLPINKIKHDEKFLCVYCGSREGNELEYKEAAIKLGKELAKRKIGLVYGGGSIGLMGAVATSVHAHGGRVISVIPKPLMRFCEPMIQPENLFITNDMHSRKKIMIDLADAFLALPGGVGTMEELLETATWLQLGLHGKRLAVLNIKGFWDHLRQLFHGASKAGFISSEHRDGYILWEDDVERVLDVLFPDFKTTSTIPQQEIPPPPPVQGLTNDWLV
jgi:uncharacterized protein (TIGR00730 family)